MSLVASHAKQREQGRRQQLFAQPKRGRRPVLKLLRHGCRAKTRMDQKTDRLLIAVEIELLVSDVDCRRPLVLGKRRARNQKTEEQWNGSALILGLVAGSTGAHHNQLSLRPTFRFSLNSLSRRWSAATPNLAFMAASLS